MELIKYLQIATGVSTLFKHPVARLVPNVAFLLANLAPRVILFNNNQGVLTPHEAIKLKKIEKIVEKIKTDLDVSSMKTNVYVTTLMPSNAFCLGNSVSLTGPVIGISRDYFENLDNSFIYSSSAYKTWEKLLSQLSDDPLIMAAQLDFATASERKLIFSLAQRFQGVITMEELQGVLAHEIGHAKNNHLAILGAIGSLLEFIFLNRGRHPFIGSTAFLLGVNSASVFGEWQADGECQNNKKYAAGILQFMKKHLLFSLSKRNIQKFPTCTENVSALLSSWDLGSSHPNHAKRMRNAYQMMKNPFKKPSKISIVSKMVAGFGALFLGAEIGYNISNIWKYYR